MTNIRQFSICIMFLLSFQNCFSQKDKEKILANFDYIDYYPDSTIRAAHKLTFTVDYFTVEFNVTGIPVAMGNTQDDEKVGEWIYSDGSVTIFPKLSAIENPTVIAFDPYDPTDHRTGSLRPGCGTGTMQAIQNFKAKYQSLLNP